MSMRFEPLARFTSEPPRAREEEEYVSTAAGVLTATTVAEPRTKKTTPEIVAQNLLNHIPGEASGFYLIAAESINNPGVATLGLFFFLGLILLVLVRRLNRASRAVMVTTILAYVLWMAIFDKGVIRVAAPNLLPPDIGAILAVFYSAVVTLLGSAGKLK